MDFRLISRSALVARLPQSGLVMNHQTKRTVWNPDVQLKLAGDPVINNDNLTQPIVDLPVSW